MCEADRKHHKESREINIMAHEMQAAQLRDIVVLVRRHNYSKISKNANHFQSITSGKDT